MAQYASVGPGGSFPPTGAVADWVRLLALPCAKASPVKRTPQKPPTRPIKLKVPSHPVLYPAAFRQRRFAAPSLREEFGGTFGHKATTNEQFARWGQDTRPAAGGETAPAENSPAGPNTIRQRLHTLRLRFATPSPAKRKNIPQKKDGPLAPAGTKLVTGILQRSPRLRIRHRTPTRRSLPSGGTSSYKLPDTGSASSYQKSIRLSRLGRTSS